MEKIYIVTAGDSFTDSHIRFCSNDLDSSKELENKFIDYKGLCDPTYALKYQLFLIKELLLKNIEFEYYNCGYGSAGNHVIKHFYKNQINELLDKGVDPENIYSTIQLSGLCRPTSNNFSKTIPGYKWDYVDNFNENNLNYTNIINKQIENIGDIIKFNIKHKITKFKIFFGWAVIFDSDIKKYNLNTDILNNDYLFTYQYKDSVDILAQNCVGTKNILDKLKDSLFKNSYKIKGDLYGGMNEVVRANTDKNEYFYVATNDPHLNTFGNWIWYITYYRSLFENWGILDSENSIENERVLFNKLNRIFEINKKNFVQSIDLDFQNNDIRTNITNKTYEEYFYDDIEKDNINVLKAEIEESKKHLHSLNITYRNLASKMEKDISLQHAIYEKQKGLLTNYSSTLERLVSEIDGLIKTKLDVIEEENAEIEKIRRRTEQLEISSKIKNYKSII